MDTLEAVARSAGGLVAVLALVWFLARMLRGRAPGGRAAGLRVTQRAALGRRSGVAVVEAGSRRVLVGVGDAQVTFLADLGDLADAGSPPGDGEPPADADRLAGPAGSEGTRRAGRPVGIVVREITDPGVPRPRSAGPPGLMARARERTVRR
jgi:hypothetical protein